MPKIAKELAAIEVARLKEPGLHPVGGVAGLRLNITVTGTRSWVLRVTVGGKRRDIGLGAFPAVKLEQAREKARAAAATIHSGGDPIAARHAKRKNLEWTFQKCAEACIEALRPTWKSDKHAAQWSATLEAYAHPVIGSKPVRSISKADVIAVLQPIWATKHETATRVRGRIEKVIAWAETSGHRPEGKNPAAWRHNLDMLLPVPKGVGVVQHHPAVRIEDVHQFYDQLRQREGLGARCLELVLLTGVRAGEALGATWREFDFNTRTWVIPASRMKASMEHRVPLSDAAVALLGSLLRFEGTDLVFVGQCGDKPISAMTMTAVMRRLAFKDKNGRTTVPHGLRSTLRDWIANNTNYGGEVGELVLAHTIKDKTEAAYRRGDQLEKRRRLMTDWQVFLETPFPTGATVTPIKRRRA